MLPGQPGCLCLYARPSLRPNSKLFGAAPQDSLGSLLVSDLDEVVRQRLDSLGRASDYLLLAVVPDYDRLFRLDDADTRPAL